MAQPSTTRTFDDRFTFDDQALKLQFTDKERLSDFRARPVGAVERDGEVLPELRAVPEESG
jgi:hypothetical protein